MSKLDELIETLIAENPEVAEDCKTKPQAISRFIGMGMKLDQTTNPKLLKEKLFEHFGHTIVVKEKKVVEEIKMTTRVWIHKETGEEVHRSFGIVNREGDVKRFYYPIGEKDVGNIWMPEEEFDDTYVETWKKL